MTAALDLVSPVPARSQSADADRTADAASRVRMPVAPTGTDTIPVAYDSVYTWSYDVERADLRQLYEKSKDLQWNSRTYLPWSTDVDPEAENTPDSFLPIFGTPLWDKLDKKRELPKLRQLGTSYLLSNFLHGEQGALLATSQIVSAVPHPDAKLYAATQVMDEARHVEAYDRYLREKVQVTFPISPYLRELLDQILTESRWDMKYLGMQILVEGLALAAFGFISQTSKEPLIREIVKMIMQDEARHVAFGVLSLKGLYDDMTAAELADREEFIVEASRLMYDRFMLQEVWEHMGMPVAECIEIAKTSESMRMFRSLLFSKIVPNTKRLGLLTPRVRKGFEELGVLQYESWEASA
ncbi:MAG: ferritin-like domain-containing protein [Polyangiaceae bacterium]